MKGEVITFYSYKGGTGRSMALANIACLLAPESPRGVLVIDWDFEAPGLHRFFRERFHRYFEARDPSYAKAPDRALDDHAGLLEMLTELDLKLADQVPAEEYSSAEQEKCALALLDRTPFDGYVLESDVPNLFVMKAGRFGAGYSERVNRFDWPTFFSRCPPLLPALVKRLAERFDYVLIDSRTGLTDVSGLCTMLLPEKLVLVFTPNRQSLCGALDLLPRATSYRRESDTRPLIVFPLPSRIEPAEPERRENWRLGRGDTLGYQPSFEACVRDAYALGKCHLGRYFDEVGIQHLSRYAYGEEIAVLVERTSDAQTLTASYKRFLAWLRRPLGPWEQLEEEPIDDPVLRAERFYASLNSADQDRVKNLLVRFVLLPRPGDRFERGRALLEPEQIDATKGTPRALLVEQLVSSQILQQDKRLKIANDRLLEWPRLRAWVDDDSPFLLWLQELNVARELWDLSGRSPWKLLRGEARREAEKRFRKRAPELSLLERLFIETSQRWSTLLWRYSVIALVLLIVVPSAAIAYQRLQPRVGFFSDAKAARLPGLEFRYCVASVTGLLSRCYPTPSACEHAEKPATTSACVSRSEQLYCRSMITATSGISKGGPWNECFAEPDGCDAFLKRCGIVDLPLEDPAPPTDDDLGSVQSAFKKDFCVRSPIDGAILNCSFGDELCEGWGQTAHGYDCVKKRELYCGAYANASSKNGRFIACFETVERCAEEMGACRLLPSAL